MKVSLNFEFNSNEDAEAFLRQVRERATRIEVCVSKEEAEKSAAKRQRKKTEQAATQAQAEVPPSMEEKNEPAVAAPKLEDVQKFVEAVFEKHGMETCRNLLSRFGVSRARDLKPEQYAAFIAEAKQVLDGKDPAAAA